MIKEILLFFNPVTLFFVGLLSILFIISKKFNQHLSVPRGPSGLPLIGVVHKLLKNQHTKLFEWSKIYGDIFQIQLASKTIVVVHSLEAMKEAIVTKSVSYAGRPHFLSWNYLYNENKEQTIAFSAYSDSQKQKKKFTQKALRLNGDFMSDIEKKVQLEVQNIIKHFQSFQNKAFNPQISISKCTANIILQFIYNIRFDFDHPEMKKFMDIIFSHTHYLGMNRCLIDGFPHLKFFLYPSIINLKNHSKHLYNLINDYVCEHKKTFNSENLRDFIDIILCELEKDADKRAISDFGVPMLEDLTEAGFETSSSMISHGLLYLITWPEVQKKIQKELDEVVGPNRTPNLSDREKLPYTEAVIQEIERLSTPLPFLLPHQTTENTTLQGYTIPKDTTIIFNAWAIHRDPRIWDEPDVFKPERFLDETGNVKVSKMVFGFGAGRRRCAGETLAKATVFLFLTGLLHQMSLLPGPDKPYNLVSNYGIVLTTKPYEVYAQMRSSHS